MLARVFRLLSFLVILVGVVCAVMTLPHYWKRYRSAKSTHERIFYALRLLGTGSFLYPILGLVILFLDGMFIDGLMEKWPTVSFIFLDWNMTHYTSMCVDIVVCVLISMPLNMGASLFGSEDGDSGQYHVPDRVAANDHIADVMGRYRAVLATNPAITRQNFDSLPRAERYALMDEYEERLDDIENRVRSVHQIWHRESPIGW